MKYKKIILSLLIIAWMATIFTFSSQVSDKSSNTSSGIIEFFLDKFKIVKNMDNLQKQQLIDNLQAPIRKIAHFSIYTLGGILTYSLSSQYEIKNKKRIIYSLLFCALYAITDELHQYFVPGRSCEIRDMLIDSSGALLGIMIAYYINRFIHKVKK